MLSMILIPMMASNNLVLKVKLRGRSMRLPRLYVEVLTARRLLDLSMITATAVLLLRVMVVTYEITGLLVTCTACRAYASGLGTAMGLLLLVGMR